MQQSFRSESDYFRGEILTNLEKVVDSFRKKKILVLGDVMLDHYICGTANRLSPEAPVPIVNVFEEKYVLGGAANVAANIATLGGKVYLGGIIGKDSAGRIFKDIASKMGIDLLLHETKDFPTIVKTRVIANRHQLVRFDSEKKANVCQAKNYLEKLYNVNESVDVVAFSDYNKGFFSSYRPEHFFLGKSTLADPKPVNIDYFKNVDCICPNLKEALEIIGEKENIIFLNQDNKKLESELFKVSNKISENYNCDNVVITCGEHGMYAFVYGSKSQGRLISAKAREVYDVSGAGDTALAVLALSWTAGIDIYDVCRLANAASGVVVGRLGTATLTREELKENLRR